ncbi:MAG: SPASM domain-containing protein [Pseudomonadota bacterium]|nr:SPASM domain-containing protein [Pseudomonadota bacterium]
MSRHENNLQALANLAMQQYEAGKIEQARRTCLDILATSPGETQVLTLLGLTERARYHIPNAQEAFRRAIEVDPTNETARHHLDTIEQARLDAKDTPYFREYLAQKPIYMDFPRRIAIETVGRCNAHCDFCPHSDLERRFSGMSDDLFGKIIDDLAAIPTHVPIMIMPNLVNEPFMDRQMMDRLETINQSLPQAKIYIFTNFNVLPKDFFSRIYDITNLSGINVSFNAANAAEYKQSMGIDFDRTVSNLRALMAKNRERRLLERPLTLSRVANLTARDTVYHDECRQVFSDFEEHTDYITHVKNRANWLGDIQSAQSEIPFWQPCGAWFDLNIFCNGTVPHCCMDSKGKYAIGDANADNLLDIYNAPGFRKYRETMTSRVRAEPCRCCALMQ